MKNLKPHIHAEVIKAWADGHKIEKYNELTNVWEIAYDPKWHKNNKYRIYDPLREVKEAFERGEIIELKRKPNSNWYEVYKGDDFGSDIKWLNRVSKTHPEYEWRIKPKEEFKVGDWVINTLIGNAFKIVKEKVFAKNCEIHNSYIQEYVQENLYRKATKEEVLNAPNYDGSATNDDFPFEVGDYVIQFEGMPNFIPFIWTDFRMNNNTLINPLYYRYPSKSEIEYASGRGSSIDNIYVGRDKEISNSDNFQDINDVADWHKKHIKNFISIIESKEKDNSLSFDITNLSDSVKKEIEKELLKLLNDSKRDFIYKEIESERIRQNEKWGEQNHKPIEWIGILTEEVGEVAKEAADYHFKNPYLNGQGELQDVLEDDVVQTIRLKDYRKELIQVAAVAVQMIESLDRNEHKEKKHDENRRKN